VITAQPVNDGIAFLIGHLPPPLHLLLVPSGCRDTARADTYPAVSTRRRVTRGMSDEELKARSA
jgi:hypothetical protein